MLAPALILQNVHKSYVAGIEGCRATVRALHGVSLEVEAGEMVAVVGKHGAGKSTLLLCAAGLLIPDEGCVRVHGRATTDREDLGAWYVGNRDGRTGALAMLAARDAKTRLLLLDDVLWTMDAYERQELLSLIAARAGDGCAAIVTARDELLARRLCVRVVEVRAGRLFHQDDTGAHTAARVAEPRDDILLGRL